MFEKEEITLIEDTSATLDMVDEEDEALPYKYSITSYGADYPVDALVKRMRTGHIVIPPFQRGFVWKLPQASRFVESLLLGLPVPGIFLSRDDDSGKLLVIDGQQRLRTLQYFYNGVFADSGREFALAGVDTKFRGMTYETLADEDRLRLDDAIIHATIIHQDEPTDDRSSIFQVFERLNTGGTSLSPQEIRACMYQGPFRDLLKELNEYPSWRQLLGPVDSRMRDQELVLRFLALYYSGHKYDKPMKGFLNTFMARNRHLDRLSADDIRALFKKTMDTILAMIGDRAFKPKKSIQAALVDSISVGVARRLEKGSIEGEVALQRAYRLLLNDIDEFREATETHTSDKDRVEKRIRLATSAFEDVK